MVQSINRAVTEKNKTIVSIDLQLYFKCMQMRENLDIRNNHIFRLSELHIVFPMIKVLGKYIENSGMIDYLSKLVFMAKPPKVKL